MPRDEDVLRRIAQSERLAGEVMEVMKQSVAGMNAGEACAVLMAALDALAVSLIVDQFPMRAAWSACVATHFMHVAEGLTAFWEARDDQKKDG